MGSAEAAGAPGVSLHFHACPSSLFSTPGQPGEAVNRICWSTCPAQTPPLGGLLRAQHYPRIWVYTALLSLSPPVSPAPPLMAIHPHYLGGQGLSVESQLHTPHPPAGNPHLPQHSWHCRASSCPAYPLQTHMGTHGHVHTWVHPGMCTHRHKHTLLLTHRHVIHRHTYIRACSHTGTHIHTDTVTHMHTCSHTHPSGLCPHFPHWRGSLSLHPCLLALLKIAFPINALSYSPPHPQSPAQHQAPCEQPEVLTEQTR